MTSINNGFPVKDYFNEKLWRMWYKKHFTAKERGCDMIGVKLFVVAEELQSMIDKEAQVVKGSKGNRDTLVSQALYGVQLSMKQVITQLRLVGEIERITPE